MIILQWKHLSQIFSGDVEIYPISYLEGEAEIYLSYDLEGGVEIHLSPDLEGGVGITSAQTSILMAPENADSYI